MLQFTNLAKTDFILKQQSMQGHQILPHLVHKRLSSSSQRGCSPHNVLSKRGCEKNLVKSQLSFRRDLLNSMGIRFNEAHLCHVEKIATSHITKKPQPPQTKKIGKQRLQAAGSSSTIEQEGREDQRCNNTIRAPVT